MRIIDTATLKTKKWNGKEIHFDKNYHKEVFKNLPKCYDAILEIKIVAKICLLETRGIINPYASKRKEEDYYEAKVIQLNDVLMKIDSCKKITVPVLKH